MTARQVFEATLIELSKIQAPSLKLYEFNYLFNKAINLYINKVYNVYDINLQTTDDLRVLKSTCFLTPHKVTMDKALHNVTEEGNVLTGGHMGTGTGTSFKETGYDGVAKSYLSRAHSSIQSLHGATYEVFLPIDYLHMLNCVCIYYVAKTKDCWDAGSYIEVPANRLTADSWSQIITDIYNRPSPMRPYYYIHNLNQQQIIPTDPRKTLTAAEQLAGSYKNAGITEIGTDMNGEYRVTTNGSWEISEEGGSTFTAPKDSKENSNFLRTFTLGTGENARDISLVEKPTAVRIGNTSNVRCEIRYGKDDSLFQLAEVQVDYVKVPQHIRLTQELIDLTEDTSQIMEFPDYVNQEIINELVHLVMERTNDPRLSNNMLISQSIARPTGQLQQPQQAQLG